MRYIIHYGMPRRSGRYKWGSGENPYHHGQDGISRRKPEHVYSDHEILARRDEYGRAIGSIGKKMDIHAMHFEKIHPDPDLITDEEWDDYHASMRELGLDRKSAIEAYTEWENRRYAKSKGQYNITRPKWNSYGFKI